jgi:predicted ABC-type exoprotein transport system permease subunit
MFKNIHWRQYLPYAIAAAVVYCIPVILYLQRANFTQAWLLYLGNFLFLLAIIFFLFSFNRKRKENAATTSMVAAGHITVVAGIVLACLLSFILLLLFVPGYLHSGTTEKVLSQAPANTVRDKTEGLSFMLFANAIIGNLCVGSASSIIFPFTLKRDQTKEKVPVRQAEL